MDTHKHTHTQDIYVGKWRGDKWYNKELFAYRGNVKYVVNVA